MQKIHPDIRTMLEIVKKDSKLCEKIKYDKIILNDFIEMFGSIKELNQKEIIFLQQQYFHIRLKEKISMRIADNFFQHDFNNYESDYEYFLDLYTNFVENEGKVY